MIFTHWSSLDPLVNSGNSGKFQEFLCEIPLHQGKTHPYIAYKNQKNKRKKRSKQTLWNTFIRGPPSLYYQQKLQKHRTSSVLIGANYNGNFVEIRQNRPSRIRLSRVPLYKAYKNSKNIDNKLGYYPLPSTKTQKIYNELCFVGRKLKREH